jgi:N-acyl-D-amino-acid deacylase
MPVKRLFLLLIGAALSACAPVTTQRPVPLTAYDLVITNAKVVDGTGNSWFYGDLAVRGDRIVSIAPRGALAGAPARERVDAAGLVVAPGFIDIQSHSWNQLLTGDGRVISKVTQGVTTEILGESTTPAPANESSARNYGVPLDDTTRAAELMRSFVGARGFDAWLRAMERNGNSVNVGSYLGASTVRAYAKGQAQGAPTRTELDTMLVVVRNAMQDGAFGISTALIYQPGGTPRPRNSPRWRARWLRTTDRTSRTFGRKATSCSRRWMRRSISAGTGTCR